MKRMLLVILIALIPFVLVDILLHESHGYPAGSGIPGFFALFGLVGCVTIVLISKWLGHNWLQRKDDYYDNNGVDE